MAGIVNEGWEQSEWTRALLGRDAPVEHSRSATRMLDGRRVLVSGAAGSIGSELVRQATALGAEVFLLDHDESRLHALRLELTGDGLLDDDSVVLADIRDARRLRKVMADIRPHIVFHAAAHKHLPLLERYPCEGVRTNLAGTANMVHAAVEFGVDRFINVSTDKAADPTSVLGATKWLAEQVVAASAGAGTRVASVRFGNVLGSRGSLVDTLRHQLSHGLPVTITDPDVERYFMTIPEAVGLVIEAAVLAERGETYVLDMGDPVRIVDIVDRFADLLELPPPKIDFVGLRRGEKLSEDLFSDREDCRSTMVPGIWTTVPAMPRPEVQRMIGRLMVAADEVDDEFVRAALPMIGAGRVAAERPIARHPALRERPVAVVA